MELTIYYPWSLPVVQYLSQYPDMGEVALVALDAARKRVGEDSHLSLEVYHDPEIEDEYLVLYVRQENYDDDFMRTLDEVSKEIENTLLDKSGWLLVTTDFHSPRGNI